jgi:hypothetical protein
MAIQKNFVVKNGLEVNTDLLLVNVDTGRVGIGTTRPAYFFEVQGGIGVTDVYSAGITTVRKELRVGASGTVFSAVSTNFINGVGIGSTAPEYLLDVRGPVSVGQTTLYVKGDAIFTGDVRVNDIFFDETEYIRVSGIVTTANLYVFNTGTIATGIITTLSGYNLYYSGIGTFANLVAGPTSVNTLSIGSTQVLSNDRELQNITSLDTATIATVQAAIGTATAQTFQNMSVVGMTTLSAVDIDSGTAILGIATISTVHAGIVTAASGVTTYYGSATNLVGARIGIKSEGSTVSLSGTTGTAILDFQTTTGQNVSVVANNNTGITTVTIIPGISLGLAIALGG